MKRILAKSALAALILAGLAAVAVPASAQYPDPNQSGSQTDRRKEFAELFGKLQVTSLLLSLESSLAEQRDAVDEQGTMLNPVLSAEPRDMGPGSIGSSPLGGEPESNPSPNAHDCINPPADKRARYVAAYVNMAPRFDSMGRQRGGFELREQKLAPELAGRFMPEKVREEQPGVIILVNRGDGDWAYALDDAWPEPEMARRWLDGQLGEHIDDDNAVCETATAVESLLEQAESHSISHVVEKQYISDQLEKVRKQVASVRADARRDIADTGLYTTDILPAVEQAGQHIRTAEHALEGGELDSASTALEDAKQRLAHANATYDRVISMQNQARETRRELDRLRDDTELRRVHFLPFGEEIDATYQACKELFAEYSERAHAGHSIERTANARTTALACIRDLRTRRANTQDTFELYVLHIPVAVSVVLVLLTLIFVAARTNKRQTLKYKVTPEISEWAQFVPMFERRIQRLERKYPGILGGDEHAAMSAGLTRDQIDTIDRAFAMAQRAGEVLEEANRLERDASLFNLGALEDCRTLLEDDASELTTSNTAEFTPIRHGVRDRETVPHSELLQTTDQLTQEAVSLLDDLENSDDSGGAW